MYSFSTCWNSHRHTDGRAMLREIRDLGFEHAELSHGIRVSLMPGIFEAVDAGEMKISSLHNFCPLPMGVTHAAPNLYEFSAENPRERELAIKHTLKTFEFALRVKASVVVLHLGSMEMKDYTGKLCEMLERGEKNSPKYEKLCAEISKSARSQKRKICRAHQRNAPKASARSRKTRPQARLRKPRRRSKKFRSKATSNFSSANFDSPNIVYWHDCGHAQIKENLGFIHHALHLESLAARLAGFHVHDVQFPARDHCAPGTGTIDFAALKPFVKPEHIKVFELSPSLPVEAVKCGIAHLKLIWGNE